MHTGGTGILTWEDSENQRLGEYSTKEYNDWAGVAELTNLPDSAFHRNVDKVVLAAGRDHGDVLKTALLCPPTIYGMGSNGSLQVLGTLTYIQAKEEVLYRPAADKRTSSRS